MKNTKNMMEPTVGGEQAVCERHVEGAWESIACVASSTHRAQRSDNQDAAMVLSLPALPGQAGAIPALLVADGLGSFAYAGEAARFVVQAGADRLTDAALENGAWPETLRTLFPVVQKQLAAFASRPVLAEVAMHSTPPAPLAALPDPDQSWGTTLLAAVETPGALVAAYAGNGAVFHIRGNFTDFGEHQAVPWSFTNCLNPHSVEQNGREAMYRYLSAAGTNAQATPTVLTLGKDEEFGDLLLLCTDGIHSADQVRYGAPGDGSVWGEVSAPLIALHGALRTAFQQEGELTRALLQQAVSDCLEGLRTRQLLDDDVTVGLLVTAPALAYRRKRQAAEREKRHALVAD